MDAHTSNYKPRVTAHGICLGVASYGSSKYYEISRARDGGILFRSGCPVRRLKPLYAAFTDAVTPEMGEVIEAFTPGETDPDHIRAARDAIRMALRPHTDE